MCFSGFKHLKMVIIELQSDRSFINKKWYDTLVTTIFCPFQSPSQKEHFTEEISKNVSEYEMPKSQTNPRNFEEETQSNNQSKLPRPIPWNQTSDVHRGFTLITWCWRYITWHWRQRSHTNTITSVIAAKQTAINEVYVLMSLHELYLLCWFHVSGNQKNGFL